MKKTLFTRAMFVITLLMVPMSAFGYRHFYRAGSYHSEPRFDRNFLTSFDVSIMGGSAKKGQNSAKNKAELLDIYGNHALARVFNGVARPQLTAAQTLIVNNLSGLAVLPTTTFGTTQYTGKFNYIEANISATQNMCHGFFGQINIPVRRLEVTNVANAQQGTAADQADVNWAAFYNNMSTLLAAYGVTAGNVKNTTVGDITIYGGWTYNNEHSGFLDFFDTTIKAGISIPTADKADRAQAFSIAAGYDGHVGIPVSFDMALGFYEWITWGAHVGGQFFLKQHTDMRARTHANQNGFIKLGLCSGKRDLGNLWDISSFLKADHIAGGFSLGFGYSYTAQEDTTITPDDTTAFDATIVNADETLKKWRMHTIHVNADYDFAQEGHAINPKVGVFYNHPVGGKRIFNTNTIGGNAGVNITWEF